MLAASLLLAIPVASIAQDIPANDGWVTDLADLLTARQEESLEALMESYKAGTTHEIAVLIVPGLEGRSLERFSLEVARGWGIGGEEANNGALLLVALADRKMRIEVGRGLEGTLTDSISGRIIRHVLQPAFRRGDYPGGIRAGVEAMHAAIGGDYGPLERAAGGQQRSVFSFSVAFFLFVLVMHLATSRRRYRSYRSGGGDGAFLAWMLLSGLGGGGRHHGGGWSGGGGGGGGFSGFGGGGGFSGGGASGGW